MRIFDKESTCDSSKVTMNNVKYTLTKINPETYHFQVNEPDKAVDAITLTLNELKALFFLTSCPECK
jgi:hypothetical protein